MQMSLFHFVYVIQYTEWYHDNAVNFLQNTHKEILGNFCEYSGLRFTLITVFTFAILQFIGLQYNGTVLYYISG